MNFAYFSKLEIIFQCVQKNEHIKNVVRKNVDKKILHAWRKRFPRLWPEQTNFLTLHFHVFKLVLGTKSLAFVRGSTVGVLDNLPSISSGHDLRLHAVLRKRHSSRAEPGMTALRFVEILQQFTENIQCICTRMTQASLTTRIRR